MKIFIFDPIWDKLITEELTTKLSSVSNQVRITTSVEPLEQCQELFEGQEPRILCLNPDYVSWKLNSADYQSIPNLKAILPASTSFSWIDATVANQQNIPICNIKGFSIQSVAEWAIGMMFAVARQIPMLIKANFPLDYDKDYLNYCGIELKGKTVGILGLGAIGRAIAERCQGLGMEVKYWSQNSRVEKYQYMELDSLLSSVDVLFPTMAINDQTKQILSNDRLSLLSSRAMLISIVHELFNHEFVVEMIKQNRLFGYGFEAGPESFHKLPGNIWAAPAYAWATNSSMNLSMRYWIDNMLAACQEEYPNRVN